MICSINLKFNIFSMNYLSLCKGNFSNCARISIQTWLAECGSTSVSQGKVYLTCFVLVRIMHAFSFDFHFSFLVGFEGKSGSAGFLDLLLHKLHACAARPGVFGEKIQGHAGIYFRYFNLLAISKYFWYYQIACSSLNRVWWAGFVLFYLWWMILLS